eukprot:1138990-Pelagomonas_calceolata.AAC.4
MWAEEPLPTSIKEKETHWLKRAVNLPPQSRNRKGYWESGGLLEAQGSTICLCHYISAPKRTDAGRLDTPQVVTATVQSEIFVLR